MNYQLEIKTDFDFEIEYKGKPTKYADYFSIIFQSKSQKFNTKKILETLNKIKLVKTHSEFHLIDAQKIFDDLKEAIKNGKREYYNGGNYTFLFDACDQDVEIVNV